MGTQVPGRPMEAQTPGGTSGQPRAPESHPPHARDCLALNVTGKAGPAPANRNREPLFLPYFFLISSCLNFISALLKQRNLV